MILLDTQAALWQDSGDAKLGAIARREIELATQAGEVAVSAITFWETAMLREKGRIGFPNDVMLWRRNLLANGWLEIPITGEIAAIAGHLTDMPGDPADRLIVATALQGHLLVTADHRILEWPGPLYRLDARQ